MSRPQEFETTQVLRSAMHVFWSKGYAATSLADLLAATGLSKSSLYATFGDKRALFLSAFSAYRHRHIQELEQILSGEATGCLAIEAFFRRGIAHASGPEAAYGCMTANEAVELAPHDAGIQQLVAADFQAVEDAFARAVARGQADGSIKSVEQPRPLARFLVTCLQGFQVLVRARSTPERLDDAISVMLTVLD